MKCNIMNFNSLITGLLDTGLQQVLAISEAWEAILYKVHISCASKIWKHNADVDIMHLEFLSIYLKYFFNCFGLTGI